MSMTTARKLERIRRYGTSLRRVSAFLLFVAPLASAVSLLLVLLTPNGLGPMNILGIELSGIGTSGTVQVAAALMIALSTAVIAMFFFQAMKLFGLYAEGVIFTAESVARIRRIGITLLLVPGVWLIGLLASLILDSGLPAGAGISLVSAPTGQLIAGIIVVFVSWIMDVARELREEQELVV